MVRASLYLVLVFVIGACKFNVKVDKDVVDKVVEAAENANKDSSKSSDGKTNNPKTIDSIDSNNSELTEDISKECYFQKASEKTGYKYELYGEFKLYHKGSSMEAVGMKCNDKTYLFSNTRSFPWMGLVSGSYKSCFAKAFVKNEPMKGIEGSRYNAAEIKVVRCFGSDPKTTENVDNNTKNPPVGGTKCQQHSAAESKILDSIREQSYSCTKNTDCKVLGNFNSCSYVVVSGPSDSLRMKLSEITRKMHDDDCRKELPVCMMLRAFEGVCNQDKKCILQ